MEDILVSGFIKTSMLDYPGKIASVIFLGRCNFRCGYCHNPDLVLRSDKIPKFDMTSIFKYLKKKEGWIDGICVTGGEPTLHKGLKQLLKQLKDLGLLVKLDTNGTNPEMLKEIIGEKLVDYLAMDIKSSKENYDKSTAVKVNMDKIQESIDLIKSSGVDYEFRTTITPNLIDKQEMEKIAKWLGSDTKKYCLQQFVPIKTIDESFLKIKPYLKPVMEELGEIAKKYIDNVEVRGI